MNALTERLEVPLSPQTLELLRHEAQRRGVSLDQLARDAIDFLLEQDSQARMQAAQTLFRVEAPVTDWTTMKQEIEESHGETRLP